VIELPESTLGERKAPGRIGLAACAYRCPGCPATRLPDALSLRVVGCNERLETTLEAHRHARIEVASGELPDSVEEFARLRELGVRSVATPFFGIESVHDLKSGVPGSFDRASRALTGARKAGLEAVVLAQLPIVAGTGMGIEDYESLRTLIRQTWALRARLLWYAPGDAPCIASNRE
jgi:hypothetical protein